MSKMSADLILEGGGVRGFFTMGLLHFLCYKDIKFKNIYGVSAGSLAGALFLSDQIDDFIDLILQDHDEINPNSTFADLYEAFLYFDNHILEFDFEKFKKSESEFYPVALNAKTGQPAYFDGKKANSKEELFKFLAASCAVPGVFNEVEIENNIYFDGGFVDPLPVFESFKNEKNKKLVVLTREKDYYKSYQSASSLEKALDYLKTLYAIETRHRFYNYAKDFSLYLEKNGDGLNLMPSYEISMNFLDFKPADLQKLYLDGYNQVKDREEDIRDLCLR